MVAASLTLAACGSSVTARSPSAANARETATEYLSAISAGRSTVVCSYLSSQAQRQLLDIARQQDEPHPSCETAAGRLLLPMLGEHARVRTVHVSGRRATVTIVDPHSDSGADNLTMVWQNNRWTILDL